MKFAIAIIIAVLVSACAPAQHVEGAYDEVNATVVCQATDVENGKTEHCLGKSFAGEVVPVSLHDICEAQTVSVYGKRVATSVALESNVAVKNGKASVECRSVLIHD